MATGDDQRVPLIVVMGVAGCGKTTFGRHLAERLGWLFVEGDDFHSAANIEKMASGHPLDEEDRRGWIASIVAHIERLGTKRAVLACSALSAPVRQWLEKVRTHCCYWVLLDINQTDAQQRVAARADHFMPSHLVVSQLQSLSPPDDALRLDALCSPRDNTERVIEALAKGGRGNMRPRAGEIDG